MESSAVGRPHLDGLLGQRVTRCACASPSRGVALCLALGNKGTAHFRSRCAALTTERVRTPELVGVGPSGDSNQQIREGSHEADLVRLQSRKEDTEQPSVRQTLQAFAAGGAVADVAVVGCGPAGLALSAELAAKGLAVALIGRDVPFVNNYGVWTDEFKELGLEHTLDYTWDDAVCYFGEGRKVQVGRAYGRVCRRQLREHLLGRCKVHGVQFVAGEAEAVILAEGGADAQIRCSTGITVRSRLVVMAAGAAAGKFLRYEDDAPTVAAQTAYGIEAEVEGFSEGYDQDVMLFMDFRRHHTGLWDDTAGRILEAGKHPNAGDGLWGTESEVPSFLYAMPVGGNRVFLEETCLVAKPALPFATLKRRLERRLQAMGITVTKVHEEEWSYIPVGGPLPVARQPITAFGAAANLVHPATGYSIARSLREAPALADDIAAVLTKQLPVHATAAAVWDALWPHEKRRQAAFHVFGMELLACLDLAHTNQFFTTFFRLPDFYWRGFLASSLSSAQLIAFALLTFGLAPISIKSQLIKHLLTNSAGRYLISRYLRGSGDAGSHGAEHASERAQPLTHYDDVANDA